MNTEKNGDGMIGATDDTLLLISEYRNNDDSAFDKLAVTYEPLIESMVNDSARRSEGNLEKDDLRQYALIAFSKAMLTFNTEQRDVSFGLYAKICIGNALASRARRLRRDARVVLTTDESVDLLFENDSDPIGYVIDRENVANLSELIKSNLSDFENEVFWLFAGGYSSSEIAYKLGKTEKSVDNAIFRAKKKLKNVLNGSK